jgi:hypothetical protein
MNHFEVLLDQIPILTQIKAFLSFIQLQIITKLQTKPQM